MFNYFNRYIVWEIAKLFIVTLVAFTTLIMLVGIVQQALSQGLGPMAIVQLLPYFLPISLQFAVPATLLFAVCSVYGRISADNEIVSIAAAGVSPFKAMNLALLLSFFMSLLAVWLNDIAFSWGRPGINRVVMHSFEQVAYRYLSSEGAYSSSQGFSIHVQGIGPDGRELIRPMIKPPPSNNGAPISISAKSARLKIDPDDELLWIELVDAEVNYGDSIGIKPGIFRYSVELSNATRKGTAAGHPSEYAMREIPGEIRTQREVIENTEQLLAARTAMGLAVGRYDWLSDERTSTAVTTILEGQSRLNRLAIEPWRRWASGCSCFFFVWVGIPFSIWVRSADQWVSFGACFFPILLTYYPLFAMSLGYAKDGSWHPATIWLANLMLLMSGSWWMWKIVRR